MLGEQRTNCFRVCTISEHVECGPLLQSRSPLCTWGGAGKEMTRIAFPRAVIFVLLLSVFAFKISRIFHQVPTKVLLRVFANIVLSLRSTHHVVLLDGFSSQQRQLAADAFEALALSSTLETTVTAIGPCASRRQKAISYSASVDYFPEWRISAQAYLRTSKSLPQ